MNTGHTNCTIEVESDGLRGSVFTWPNPLLDTCSLERNRKAVWNRIFWADLALWPLMRMNCPVPLHAMEFYLLCTSSIIKCWIYLCWLITKLLSFLHSFISLLDPCLLSVQIVIFTGKNSYERQVNWHRQQDTQKQHELPMSQHALGVLSLRNIQDIL